jgi:hypothetical protein
MITNSEGTYKIWDQLHGELSSYPIEGVDSSGDTLYMYIRGATKNWAIVCGGTVKIASSPEISGDFPLRPEYFVGHTLNYLRPTYPDTERFWDVESADRFMSIDDVTIELLGQHFNFLLQIDHFGISMMDN